MPEPGPLLLEQRIERGDDRFTRRVSTDGAVWSRAHLPRVDEDGWPQETGEPEWDHEATLGPGTLTTLREAIASSGFFELDAEQQPDVAVIHGSTHIWTADLDGHAKTVTLHGVPAVDVPAVTRVAEALEDALAS